MINGYNIASCKKCFTINKFLKTLITKEDEEIENPTFQECLKYIDHGELAVCTACNNQGQFNISEIIFDDIVVPIGIQVSRKPYSTYILKLDKSNGKIRAWIESGYFSIAQVSIAFDAIKEFVETDLWFEPLEGDSDGSFELRVEFYQNPFEKKVHLNNKGYSQDEIIMVVKGLYDGIPNDQK